MRSAPTRTRSTSPRWKRWPLVASAMTAWAMPSCASSHAVRRRARGGGRGAPPPAQEPPPGVVVREDARPPADGALPVGPDAPAAVLDVRRVGLRRFEDTSGGIRRGEDGGQRVEEVAARPPRAP